MQLEIYRKKIDIQILYSIKNTKQTKVIQNSNMVAP
jgi:hypothetical protein